MPKAIHAGSRLRIPRILQPFLRRPTPHGASRPRRLVSLVVAFMAASPKPPMLMGNSPIAFRVDQLNRLPKRRRTTTAEQRNLVDRIYIEILRHIIRGDFPGGCELKTTRLAEKFRVSRTPIFFALSRLISDGIVIQRRNFRAIVNVEAQNWLLAVHELRILLEPTAGALAASRISAKAIARLEQLSQAAEPRRSPRWIQKSMEFDIALHLTIADNSGNEALRQAIHKCWRYKRLSYCLGASSSEVLERNHPEHLAILTALKQQDARQVAEEMKTHLRNAALHLPADC
jgi:DNA-binding GntR family transcriptional regulator